MSRPGPALTEPAADAAIASACRVLHLPTLRERFAELADAAARERLSYRAFLSELLLAEVDERDARRRERRVREAGFPLDKRLSEFDFGFNPAIGAAVVHTPGDRRLGRRRRAAVPDRGLRHRQDPL